MKFSIFNSFLVLFVFVLASFAPSTEFTYTSIDGKFSITFPAAHESVSKKTENLTTVKTQATFEDQLYLVSYTIHKVKMMDRESLAASSLESFNEAVGGTITKQAKWAIKKHKGLQADIQIPAKNLIAEYRVILIGQIQYQITVFSESTNWNQLNADKFIESFKVEE